MKKPRRNGFTLIGGLVGGLVLTLSVSMVVMAFGSSKRLSTLQRQKALAESYATELLEAFRSMTGMQLNNYLSSNPINAAILSAYPLCAHINILDRNSNEVLNADPRADLGPTRLDGENGPANRFYSVQVINMQTRLFVDAHCNKTPCQGPAPACDPVTNANQYQYNPLDPRERFFVTVGVSWVPQGLPPKRTVFSTVIPE